MAIINKFVLEDYDVLNFPSNLRSFIKTLQESLNEVPEDYRDSVNIRFDYDCTGIKVDIDYLYRETSEDLEKKAQEKIASNLEFLKKCKDHDLAVLKGLMRTYNIETTTNLEEL